jgi:lipopolysaccharide transport system permease protein
VAFLASLVGRRELLYALALRDLKTRFFTLRAGAAYTFLVSAATMVVLSVVFGTFFRDRVAAPYPAYVFVGLVPWSFLSHSVSQSVESFRSSAPLVRKVPFPRALVPLGIVGSNLVIMLISLAALAPILIAFGVRPGWGWLAAPVALLPLVVLAAGAAMLVSTAAVFWIEVRPATDVGLMLWFYATPIFYPASIVPPRFGWIPALNPVARALEVLRALLLDGAAPPPAAVALSWIPALLVFAAGAALLRRYEGVIPDHVG